MKYHRRYHHDISPCPEHHASIEPTTGPSFCTPHGTYVKEETTPTSCETPALIAGRLEAWAAPSLRGRTLSHTTQGSNPSAATAQGRGRRRREGVAFSICFWPKAKHPQGAGDSPPRVSNVTVLPADARRSRPAVLHFARWCAFAPIIPGPSPDGDVDRTGIHQKCDSKGHYTIQQ